MVDDGSKTPAYVAYCKCGCGGMVFACVDDDEKHDARRKKETANEVAKMIRRGYAVSRITVGEVRKSKFSCQKESA